MSIKVDLILPGLFQLPAAEMSSQFLQTRLPALNQWLSYGSQSANHLDNFERLISDSLGVDDPLVLPVACAFQEPEKASRCILCRATHLKPDMRNAFVVPLDNLARTNEDKVLLINDLHGLFKEDLHIEKVDSEHWLMEVKNCQLPQHYPHYLSIVGRKVDPYIQQSRGALPWYQLTNEIQMFMHSHTVNQQRLLDGLLPINSLWCWGAGQYLPTTPLHIDTYCDDPILSSYLSKITVSSESHASFKEIAFARDTVIVRLDLLEALKSANDVPLESLMLQLESELFSPLIEVLLKPPNKFKVTHRA